MSLLYAATVSIMIISFNLDPMHITGWFVSMCLTEHVMTRYSMSECLGTRLYEGVSGDETMSECLGMRLYK